MKKIKGKILMLLAVLFMGVSCTSSDNEIQQIGNEFDGVYKGTLEVDVNDAPFGGDIPQKVYITKSGDNNFKMELKNFVIVGLNIGDIVVNNIDVVKTGENCTFSGQEVIDIAIGTCDVAVEGTISGSDIDMDINVNVLEAVGGGATPDMKVFVDFDGVKMAADQSSEAKITSFVFDTSNQANKIVTSQPVIDGTNITFNVSDEATAEQLMSLLPTITISDKATITPAVDAAVNFNNEVEYAVTSEDGIYTTKYKVYVAGKSLQYSFNEWEMINYLIDFEQVSPMDILESANRGTAFLSLYGFAGDSQGNRVNTIKTEGVSGYAAKLITFDTRSIANALVPGVTPGTLYVGKFNVGAAMVNRLMAAEFGLAFDKKEPIAFKGSYKYTPGAVFYDASNHEAITEVADKTDECSIMAVLFEIENDSDVLTGVDINTSDKRVAVATLADGTAKAEWTSFEIPFEFLEGKTYDPSKKYKITFVCTSSKEGDYFKGAPGSALSVDEFEIVYKSHE